MLETDASPVDIGDPHPGVSLEIRQHDRLNLELKIEYPTPDITQAKVETLVDVWFFLPPAIGASAETYDSEDFYGDLRAHTRLKTPYVPLDDLARRDGPLSPLSTLGMLRQHLPAGTPPQPMGEAIRREARLLCCMFRRSVRGTTLRLQALAEHERDAEVVRLAQESRALLAAWRGARGLFADVPLVPRTRAALAICDEALSLDVEALMSRILLDVPGISDDARLVLAKLAVEERKLRVARGDRSAAMPDDVDPDVRACFWDQASLLKKFVSQSLYLFPQEHRGAKALEHLAKAIAAALAMAWTVALQIATVFLLGLELNSSVDLKVVVLFSLLAVGGYILKDRMKETIGRRLASFIPRLLYDRRLDLYHPESTAPFGQVRERVNISSKEPLPGAVDALRSVSARNRISLWTDTQTLHYERRMSVLPRSGTRSFARLDGLTDILRLNLSTWVRTLDDRKKRVAVVSDDGFVSSVEVPNRYVVDVITRVTNGTGARCQGWRLTLTRRGIERVEGFSLSVD